MWCEQPKITLKVKNLGLGSLIGLSLGWYSVPIMALAILLSWEFQIWPCRWLNGGLGIEGLEF